MVQEKLICHASGDFSKPFIVGFYLYHIVQDKDNLKSVDYIPPLKDLESFENELLEVEVIAPKEWCECKSQANNFSGNISNPISIQNCDISDESDVPIFLRNVIDTAENVQNERPGMFIFLKIC